MLWHIGFLIGLSVASAVSAQTPRTMFVTVEKDVALEVLDWGGVGVPVVLMAGRGQTAHSFEGFAPTLAAHYRVVGITRRGFGASSKPSSGYLADDLADDVLAVVDSLRLVKPVLVGHSLAGQELSSIGSRHPEKVAGLVYLDAAYAYAFYDTTRGDFRADVAVLKRRLERLQQAANRGDVAQLDSLLETLLSQELPALRRDLTAMQRALSLGQFPRGEPLLPPVRTGIDGAIDDGFERYTNIRSPVLAIFALRDVPVPITTDRALMIEWLQSDRGAAGTFARGVPQAQIVILPNADHFVFDSGRTETLAAMRGFIAGLVRR